MPKQMKDKMKKKNKKKNMDMKNMYAEGGKLKMVTNDAGSPSAAITGLTAIEIKSPFFRIKFTNGNGSSRDVNLSFVSIFE